MCTSFWLPQLHSLVEKFVIFLSDSFLHNEGKVNCSVQELAFLFTTCRPSFGILLLNQVC